MQALQYSSSCAAHRVQKFSIAMLITAAMQSLHISCFAQLICIPVMEAPALHTQLVQQLKVGMHAAEGLLHGVQAGVIPGPGLLQQLHGRVSFVIGCAPYHASGVPSGTLTCCLGGTTIEVYMQPHGLLDGFPHQCCYNLYRHCGVPWLLPQRGPNHLPERCARMLH